MSRLSDLYNAMNTLRKEGVSIDEELEKQINILEEDIIKKEILPIVTKNIAPALKEVQRELVLVVDYMPNQPISVHLSRKRNFTAELADAKKILPDPPITHNTIGKIQTSQNITRQKDATIEIVLKNNFVIKGKNATDSFVQFVNYAGVNRIRKLGIIQRKVPLITNTYDEKYKPKKIDDDWYLMTHSDTKEKIRYIKKIAKELNIELKTIRIASTR